MPSADAAGQDDARRLGAADKDATYRQVLASWSQQRLGYMVLKSLEPSQIEWDTVKEDDPQTWKNWSADLRNGGLSDMECHRVMNLVLEANCLDEAKLKKAREVFLAGQEPKARILWPSHRTAEYAVWCACERLGILPPGVRPTWDECSGRDASLDVAFDQTRTYDESEREARLMGARSPCRGERRFLTMKFTGNSLHRASTWQVPPALDKPLREASPRRSCSWLEATVMAEVPVWSGASRATFLAVAQHRVQHPDLPRGPQPHDRRARRQAAEAGT